jgi:dinuclear metal center YbgI/SA1388 family protein
MVALTNQAPAQPLAGPEAPGRPGGGAIGLLRRLATLMLALVLSVSVVACSGSRASTPATLSPEAISAITRQADALLVHHGWFWKGEDPRILGTRKRRLASVLKHDLNLLAYHLPLDSHPVLGNNAQLARVLGFVAEAVTASNGLLWFGSMPGANTLAEVADRVEQRLARTPLVIGAEGLPIQRIAWCTGAAQSMLGQAIDAGAQVFITGEVSEPTVHLAREAGVGFISAGHHATERFGVQALGQAIAQEFGISVDFVDIDNPV